MWGGDEGTDPSTGSCSLTAKVSARQGPRRLWRMSFVSSPKAAHIVRDVFVAALLDGACIGHFEVGAAPGAREALPKGGGFALHLLEGSPGPPAPSRPLK